MGRFPADEHGGTPPSPLLFGGSCVNVRRVIGATCAVLPDVPAWVPASQAMSSRGPLEGRYTLCGHVRACTREPVHVRRVARGCGSDKASTPGAVSDGACRAVVPRATHCRLGGIEQTPCGLAPGSGSEWQTWTRHPTRTVPAAHCGQWRTPRSPGLSRPAYRRVIRTASAGPSWWSRSAPR